MKQTMKPYIVSFPENEVIVQSFTDSKVVLRIRENDSNEKVHIQTFEFTHYSPSEHWAHICYAELLRIRMEGTYSTNEVLAHMRSLEHLMHPIISAALLSK